MMPVFLFENVVYRLSLFSMYSILILTLPLVFLPLLGGDFFGPGFRRSRAASRR